MVTQGPNYIGMVPYTLLYKSCRLENCFPKRSQPTIYNNYKRGAYVPDYFKDIEKAVNLKGPISPPCISSYRKNPSYFPVLPSQRFSQTQRIININPISSPTKKIKSTQ